MKKITIEEIIKAFEQTFKRKITSDEMVMIFKEFNMPSDRRCGWITIKKIME